MEIGDLTGSPAKYDAGDWRLEMEIGDDFLFFIFYFRPEEPAALSEGGAAKPE